jgi:hypothetical protein
MPARRHRSADELHRHHDEFGDPLNLEDIGLDDMSLSRIVIELSQTRDHFKIWAPYNDNFRRALKSTIPAKSRRWDPDETCWRVDCYWFGNAQEMIHEHFPGLERYYTERAIMMCERLAEEDDEEDDAPPKKRKKKSNSKGKCKSRAKAKYKTKKVPPPNNDDPFENWSAPKPPPPSEETQAYETLGISPNAPDEVVKAAHKALARKHHTDTNKDPNDKTINKINAAFETIKEIRGW